MAKTNVIEVIELEDFPVGDPMKHDFYHMGMCMGTNLTFLHANHASAECRYLILVNPKNGNRIRINFTPDWNKEN